MAAAVGGAIGGVWTKPSGHLGGVQIHSGLRPHEDPARTGRVMLSQGQSCPSPSAQAHAQDLPGFKPTGRCAKVLQLHTGLKVGVAGFSSLTEGKEHALRG